MAEYPGAIPTFTDPAATDRLDSPSHAAIHVKVHKELTAITSALGVSPADAYATVGARLAALEDYSITNTGTGDALTIINSGTGFGINLVQLGVLANNTHSLYVYNKAARINSSLFHVYDENASSSYAMAQFSNSGSGNTLEITQSGAGTSLQINNSGTGAGLIITQTGVLANNTHSLYVYNKAARINSNLVHFYDENASSSYTMVQISNGGTGTALNINQSVNLASGNYALYIDNNGTPADGAGKCIRLDGCTTTTSKAPQTDAAQGFISINIDGTARAVPYYAIT